MLNRLFHRSSNHKAPNLARDRKAAREARIQAYAEAFVAEEKFDTHGDIIAIVLRTIRDLALGLPMVGLLLSIPIWVIWAIFPYAQTAHGWVRTPLNLYLPALGIMAAAVLVVVAVASIAYYILNVPYRWRRGALRRRRGVDGRIPKIRRFPKIGEGGWDPLEGPPQGFPELDALVAAAQPDPGLQLAPEIVVARSPRPAPQPPAPLSFVRPKPTTLGETGAMASQRALARRMLGPLRWQYEVRLGNGSTYRVDADELERIHAAQEAGASLVTVTTLDLDVGNVDINVHGIAEIVRCAPSELEILNRVGWPNPKRD